jgi:hypothetical protein
MPAAVVFAFGDRPGVPAEDAVQLADLLAQQRSLASDSLAAKIREQAKRDFAAGEKSEDIELSADEMVALSHVLAVEPWPKEQPWFEHLRDELNRHTGLASD